MNTVFGYDSVSRPLLNTAYLGSLPPALDASAGAMDLHDQNEAVAPTTAGPDPRQRSVGLSTDQNPGLYKIVKIKPDHYKGTHMANAA